MAKRIAQRLRQIREFHAEATPSLPLIRDSLRIQTSEYEIRHQTSGLSFVLRPRTGDWFTFYEVCIRNDYFPMGLKLEPGDQVIDIGGNFGAFSVIAASKVGPTGMVHCYEPSADNVKRIRFHAEKNGLENVHVEQRAVGGEPGEITLYTHEKTALSTTMEEIDGRSSKGLKPVKVRQVPVSEVLFAVQGEIALMKIDCEGAEYDIVEQISPADLSRIRMLVIETHDVPGKSRDDILSRLRENGFEISEGNPFFASNTDHR